MVASPLGAARARRHLTVEEAAARADLDPQAVRSLEESRVYRFESVEAALAATLVYSTALGISSREARELAGLPVPPRPVARFTLGRLAAVIALLLAGGAVAWFVVSSHAPREAAAEAPPPTSVAPAAAVAPGLPQPWEIQVDIYNGTGEGRAATLVANEIAGLAYRLGDVTRAERVGYEETRVYYPPGARAIAERLAAELGGLGVTALPGGNDPLRLVVIVGADRTP